MVLMYVYLCESIEILKLYKELSFDPRVVFYVNNKVSV